MWSPLNTWPSDSILVWASGSLTECILFSGISGFGGMGGAIHLVLSLFSRKCSKYFKISNMKNKLLNIF